MRRFRNIYILAFAFVALVGCSKEPQQPNVEVDNIPSGPIMEFGINLDTRAEIIPGGEGTILDKLGLYGYQYANQTDSEWTWAQTTALPNVFNNTPEPLTYDSSGRYYNASDTYTWTGNKYAFFAYYPFEHTSFECSPNTEPGTPYLTYTLDRSDVENMADIMSSARTNLTSVNRYVTFHMIHRLSAVDVDVCNIYQHDETVDGVTTYYGVDIEIHTLVLKFSNLHNDKSKIYLDARGHSEATESTGDKTATYQFVQSTDPITVEYKANDDDPNYTLTEKHDLTMFFIPQEEKDLAVSVDVTFKKKLSGSDTYLTNNDKVYTYDNDGVVTNEANAEGYGTEFFYVRDKSVNFEQDLEEGYRYFVTLNFTSAAVSINIVTATQWQDTKDDIIHGFD